MNTDVPNAFWQGDTVSWTKDIDQYRSTDGWTLTYLFSRSTDNKTVTAVGQADGTYLVTILPAESALWLPGQYRWQGYVEQAPERYTIGAGSLQCIESLDAAIETRTHAEKVVDALEAVLEGKASSDQLKVSIGGKALDRMSWEELTSALRYYKSELVKEQANDASRSGGLYPNLMLGRF